MITVGEIAIVEAFQTSDGILHKTKEDAVKHDINRRLDSMFTAITDELGRDPGRDDVRQAIMSRSENLQKLLDLARANGITR